MAQETSGIQGREDYLYALPHAKHDLAAPIIRLVKKTVMTKQGEKPKTGCRLLSARGSKVKIDRGAASFCNQRNIGLETTTNGSALQQHISRGFYEFRAINMLQACIALFQPAALHLITMEMQSVPIPFHKHQFGCATAERLIVTRPTHRCPASRQ